MTPTFKLQNVLFLDIETVPKHASWNKLDKEEKELFASKTKYQRGNEYAAEAFYDRAGIWAEFGKIICISVGYFNQSEFRVRSFFGDDEREILMGFKRLLEQYFWKKEHFLCAHNGKEFDFPYIARRMLIQQIALPDPLNLFGKKPWEVKHLDTLELWKFGDYKHYTSLKLLTHILGIPSPKEDMDGAAVGKVYYEDRNMHRIVDYCERDTIAVAQVILRFHNLPLLKEENVFRHID